MASTVSESETINSTTTIGDEDRISAVLIAMDIEQFILPAIPVDYIDLFILKKSGDFCLSRTAYGGKCLSMCVEDDQGKRKVINLAIDQRSDDEYCIRGMPFVRASSVGRLLYEYHKSPIGLLAGILNEPVSFSRLIGCDALESAHIYFSSSILEQKAVHFEHGLMHYSGDMLLEEGRTTVCLVSPNDMTDCEFRRLMFDELRMAVVARMKGLPIRYPIGIVIDKPMIIHQARKGYSFEYFLRVQLGSLDVPIRIQICAALACVMSELHTFGIYHGGVVAKNFYVYEEERRGRICLSLVFNGSKGLVKKGTLKIVQSGDFDLFAPEVAWTRSLTPESGVHNLGKLFERVVDYANGDRTSSLYAMQEIVSSCIRSNPFRRPTIDGIVLKINQLMPTVPATTTKYSVVPFSKL